MESQPNLNTWAVGVQDREDKKGLGACTSETGSAPGSQQLCAAVDSTGLPVWTLCVWYPGKGLGVTEKTKQHPLPETEMPIRLHET